MLRGMVLLLEILLVVTVIALDSMLNKGRNAKTLISTKLYLEPDLSVQRLHVTVRALSVAIKRTQEMNVSQ